LAALVVPSNWSTEETKARKAGRIYVIRDKKTGMLSSNGRTFAGVLQHPRSWLSLESAKKRASGAQVVRMNSDYSTTLVIQAVKNLELVGN
jgi:hypothetical protein